MRSRCLESLQGDIKLISLAFSPLLPNSCLANHLFGSSYLVEKAAPLDNN